MSASIWSPGGGSIGSIGHIPPILVDVRDFGVTGDGSDELSKLHAAVAGTPSKGTLVIPPGFNIRISGQFSISKDIHIVGFGASITELAGFAGTYIIRSTAANTIIEGLKVVGLDTGKSGIGAPGTNLGGFTVLLCEVTGCGYGIIGSNNSRVLIEKNYVHDNSLYGIWCQNTLDVEALNSIHIYNNFVNTSHLDPTTATQICVLVRGTATYYNTDVKISGNRLVAPVNPTNSGALGCEVRYCEDVAFTENYGKDGAMVVSAALSSRVSIANNNCDGQTFYAIEVTSLTGSPITEVSVTGNNINGKGILNYGIGLQGTEENAKCTVANNTITGTAQYGIFVSHVWSGVAITGNVVEVTNTSTSYGIYCLGNTSAIQDIAISGNMLLGGGTGKKAIYLYDTSNVAISGNVLSGWIENGVLIHSVGGTVDRIAIGGNTFVNTIGRVAMQGAGAFGDNITVIGNVGYASGSATGTNMYNLATNLLESWGTATPEGAITANVGSTFRRTNGGAGTTLYVKESGTGNTGWVGK